MSVPVLMYHHVLPSAGFIASSASEFEAQMRYLATHGWRALSMDEFLAWKKGELELPRKSVLITFDDGWRDNFVFAYPILKKYCLRATIFLVTGWIDAASEGKSEFAPLDHSAAKAAAPRDPRSVILNWDEVAAMSDICDFRSHTHTHGDDYFGSLAPLEDLSRCRETMKRRLGLDDTVLCWPRGKYDENRLKIALSLGYKAFFTTQRGVNKPDGDLSRIKRVAVKGGAGWLAKTLFIYSSDFWGEIYTKLKK